MAGLYNIMLMYVGGRYSYHCASEDQTMNRVYDTQSKRVGCNWAVLNRISQPVDHE